MAAVPSTLAAALARVGDRWSLVLVEALLEGPKRFADLQGAVPGISTNVLAARLRHLEAEAVVLATPYSDRPLRYAYELTDAGRDLGGAVRLLSQWSAEHGGAGADASGAAPPGSAGAARHELCGTPMEAVWWCPTCDQPGGAEPPEAVWV